MQFTSSTLAHFFPHFLPPHYGKGGRRRRRKSRSCRNFPSNAISSVVVVLQSRPGLFKERPSFPPFTTALGALFPKGGGSKKPVLRLLKSRGRKGLHVTGPSTVHCTFDKLKNEKNVRKKLLLLSICSFYVDFRL